MLATGAVFVVSAGVFVSKRVLPEIRPKPYLQAGGEQFVDCIRRGDIPCVRGLLEEDEPTQAGMTDEQFGRFVKEWIAPGLQPGVKGKLEGVCCDYGPIDGYVVPLRAKTNSRLNLQVLLQESGGVRLRSFFHSLILSQSDPQASGIALHRNMAKTIRSLEREWAIYGVRQMPGGASPRTLGDLAASYEATARRLAKRARAASSRAMPSSADRP